MKRVEIERMVADVLEEMLSCQGNCTNCVWETRIKNNYYRLVRLEHEIAGKEITEAPPAPCPKDSE